MYGSVHVKQMAVHLEQRVCGGPALIALHLILLDACSQSNPELLTSVLVFMSQLAQASVSVFLGWNYE